LLRARAIYSPMTDHRLQKLEETLAHQDQQIADLSEMLILQAREISKLSKDLLRLKAKIEHYEGHVDGNEDRPLSGAEFAAQNKPPHY